MLAIKELDSQFTEEFVQLVRDTGDDLLASEFSSSGSIDREHLK